MQTQQDNGRSRGSSSNIDSNPQPNFPQVRKLNFDLPRFDGTNALDWIFNADRFFDYYNIPDMERISIASTHIDKGVVPWFQTKELAFLFLACFKKGYRN